MRNTKQETESAGLTEIELLAQLELIFEGELRCEAIHHEMNPVCSDDVTILFKGCAYPNGLFGCSNSQKFCVWFFEIGGFCGCGRLAVDCWKVIPI